MKGMQKLPELHAMLAIGLPEGACSHMFCLSLLRRAHPNGRVVEPAGVAHGAGSRFVREQMLAQAVPADSMRPNERNAEVFFLSSHRFHRKKGYGALPHVYP